MSLKSNIGQTSVVECLVKLFAGFTFFFGLAGLLIGFRGILEYLGVFFVLALSVCLVCLAYKNILLFVMAIFMSYANYSALAANYFNIYQDFYTYYAGSDVAAIGTFAMLMFVAVLVFCFPRNVTSFGGINFFGRCRQLDYAAPLAFFIAVFLVFISFTQSSGFNNGGERGTNSAIYEYSYILFIIGYFYSGQNKLCRRLLDCVALLFMLQAVLGGNRASVLATVLLLYTLYIANRFSTSKQVLLIILGFLLFQVSGYLREDIAFASTEELVSIFTTMVNHAFIWDTAAAAYHQSLAFMYLLQYLSFDETLYYFQQWFLGMLVGGAQLADWTLPHIAQETFGLYERGGLGGGFLPLYFYFYFGIPGVLVVGIIAAYINRALNRLSNTTSDLGCMLLIAVFITMPRWWLYYPTPLIRGLLLMLIVGGVVCFLNGNDVHFRKRRKDIRNRPKYKNATRNKLRKIYD